MRGGLIYGVGTEKFSSSNNRIAKSERLTNESRKF